MLFRSIRVAVALNPNTPDSLLENLEKINSDYGEEEIAYAIKKRPLPMEWKIIPETDLFMLEKIKGNDTPESEVNTYSSDYDSEITKDAVKKLQKAEITESILTIFSDSPDRYVRAAVILNLKTPDKLLEKLKSDKTSRQINDAFVYRKLPKEWRYFRFDSQFIEDRKSVV